MNTIKIMSTRGHEATFELPDGWALTVEVNGREYVGVSMPEPDVHPIEVVTWRDEAGEDNVTHTPPGVPVN